MGLNASRVTGLVVEQRPDGIVVYRVRNVKRETADALYEAFHNNDLEAFQERRHSRTILDLRGAGWPTPYGTARMIQSADETPEGLCESTAVITSDSVAMQLVGLLLQKLPARTQRSTRLFLREDDAVEWLKQRLIDFGP
jgi:hypothetical protein